MDTVFFGTNRLVLVKATLGLYWAAMLGSVAVMDSRIKFVDFNKAVDYVDYIDYRIFFSKSR